MNDRRIFLLTAATLPATADVARATGLTRSELIDQVRVAESSFAATMAARDLPAFASHVADDAVFINAGSPLRGKDAVVAHWRRFFSEPAAPFAWRPEIVEVAGSGQLAYSEGPVLAPSGATFARFYSTWRRESNGKWLVVFDNGYEVCPSQPK